METVADRIETYLKQLISRSPSGVIELQRNLVAERFACVPSQITYVLATRFTAEKGYLVESRRGGGGFLRIQRISLEHCLRSKQMFKEHEELLRMINSTVGSSVSQSAGEVLIARLEEEGFLSGREARLLRSIIARESIPLGLPERDVVRSSILRSILLVILQDEE